MVLRRKDSIEAPVPPARVLIAKEGAEDKALRTLRLAERPEVKDDKQVEIFSVSGSLFHAGVWLPERREVYELKARLNRLPFPKGGAIFTIHQGIRTGDNQAFILTAEEYQDVDEPERVYFRPVAGQGALKYGQLMPSYFVFYPYGPDGKASIASEEQLIDVVPKYHEKYLKGRKAKLARRAKIREWWLLTWPRPWQAGKVYKWVSTYFGAAGSFAYDDEGDYVVVQGYAWIGKPKLSAGGALDIQGSLRNTPLPWAYLSILNSRLFEEILASYCPRVQGGQYNLSNRFVKDIPIPNLGDPQFSSGILKRLADLGRRIHDGEFETVVMTSTRPRIRHTGCARVSGHPETTAARKRARWRTQMTSTRITSISSQRSTVKDCSASPAPFVPLLAETGKTPSSRGRSTSICGRPKRR